MIIESLQSVLSIIFTNKKYTFPVDDNRCYVNKYLKIRKKEEKQTL